MTSVVIICNCSFQVILVCKLVQAVTVNLGCQEEISSRHSLDHDLLGPGRHSLCVLDGLLLVLLLSPEGQNDDEYSPLGCLTVQV